MSTSAGMDRKLHEAIVAGDLAQVHHLVSGGVSVNCYVDGLTPMARAVTSDQLLIAKALLDLKPDVHQGRRNYCRLQLPGSSNNHQVQHEPLLILAVMHNYPDLVQSLIDMGADVNATDIIYGSALHIAVAKQLPDVLRILLDNGSNVNHVDIDSNSALHTAVKVNNVDMARTLVSANAVVNLPGKKDVIPLHTACEVGNINMVKFLLDSGSMVNCKDTFLSMPLHYAAKMGYEDIVEELLSHQALCDEMDDRLHTPLYKACLEGHAAVVRVLVIQGRADPNLECGACRVKKLPLQIAASEGHKTVVKTLLELGADVNLCDSIHGENALNASIRKQDEDIIDMLLSAGVDVHGLNVPDGSSCLHVACLFDNYYGTGSSAAILEKLLKTAVDVNIVDQCKSETALHIAARRGCCQLVELLLRKPEICVNELDNSNLTPLRSAIYYKESSTAQLLIENGADFNHFPSDKSPCLHAAISRSLYQVAVTLIQHGADVAVVDRQGHTPLATICNNVMEAEFNHRPTNVMILGENENDEELGELLNFLLATGARAEEFRMFKHGSNITRKLLMTRKNLLDLYEQIMLYSGGSPAMLQQLAVNSVRRRLINVGDGSSIWPLVYKLPVPGAVRDQLCLKHINFPSQR